MCNFTKFRLLAVVFLYVLTSQTRAESTGTTAVILYVDDTATGANNGISWMDAFADLQSALDVAQSLPNTYFEIRVAQGVYKPSKQTTPNDSRSATFILPGGVVLRGGYAGGDLGDQDDMNYETIFSGDLSGNDGPVFAAREDNVYHVVTVPIVTDLPTLDRVVVQGGFSPGFGGGVVAQNGIRLSRCRFEGNIAGMPFSSDEGSVAHFQGGGAVAIMATMGSGTAIDMCWDSCSFYGNISSGTGGAVFAAYGNITMTDCFFDDNVAGAGGAIGAEWFGRLVLEGCQFSRNRGEGNYFGDPGGALMVYYDMDSLNVSTCVFERNEGRYGGAINVSGVAGDVSVRDSFFFSNSATYVGGAITGRMLSFEIKNSHFEDNHSGFGGAVALSLFQVPIRVANSSFHRNTALYSGGALDLDSDDLIVEHCNFDSNYSYGSGGAVRAGGKANYVDCIFSGNYASSSGGALRAEYENRLMRCVFQQNSAGSGGGISTMEGPVLIDQCRFGMNSAVAGGAVFLYNPKSPTEIRNSLFINGNSHYGAAIAAGYGILEIEHTTIVHNSAAVLGGALIGGPGTRIRNSILWDNIATPGGIARRTPDAQIEGLVDVEVAYSTVEHWLEANGGVGNSANDPMLIQVIEDESWFRPFDGNLRLSADSPARNAGDPDFVPAFRDTDLDGHARVLCGRVDMGAYESGFGDGDCDGVSNLWDFAFWSACAEGEIEGEACDAMDSDVDGDFDLRDFAAIQMSY
jgi:predicted outer membrane repeat protein